MKMLKNTALALAAAMAPALGAQDGSNGDGLKSYLALGLTIAQGDSRDLTQSSYNVNNWSAEAGLEFYNPFAKIHFRPNVGMAKMGGADQPETWPWPTYQMLAWHVGFDLAYKNPRNWPISFTAGPSFHVWNVERLNYAEETGQNAMSLKFGWRVGAEYKVNDKWTVNLAYTLTEWHANEDPGEPQPGLNPSRPTYFTLKGIYTF